ncbi:MAG: TetR/AcrR family transcriptional regulator [Rhodobacteraceae bacterium]|nr:TetR/AcrR family transcriptional regulator [Paracoccaceae bacterium]
MPNAPQAHVPARSKKARTRAKTAGGKRRSPRTEARLGAILEAAEIEFLNRGYAGASLDTVAKRANASKATMYAHFGNKVGLFRAIIGTKLPIAFGPLFSIPERTSLAAAEVLRRAGTGFLTLMLSPLGIKFYRLIVSEGVLFPDLAKAWFTNGPRRAIGALADFFRERTASGELSVDDPEHAAEFFLMMLRGSIQMQAVSGLSSPPYEDAIAAKVDAAVKLMMAAYGRQSNSPTTSSSQRRVS